MKKLLKNLIKIEEEYKQLLLLYIQYITIK
jgi:hypothetical protein